MSLSVPEKFITNMETFTWGKDWRAIRIIKEKRTDGEYFFARIVRYFGEKEDTHDYDIAERYSEAAWLGRVEKFVGKRITDLERDSKTFGKRIYTEAITETVSDKDLEGKPMEREVLVKGKAIYEYTIPVNADSIKKMKELQGSIALNQETQFLFVYGANPPLVVTPEIFFETTVADYLKKIAEMPVAKKEQSKK